MRELKNASISGRKRLNDITKSFRSKSKDEQILMMAEVLKSYQEEIDQLSRRSKFSESSFQVLYKDLSEAPDPCPVIESLMLQVSAASTHQLEIKRLKTELAQYDEEFQLLKNQDITIRHLEDQLKDYREQFEEKVTAELATRITQVEERAEARVQEVKEHQRAVERRLAAAVESMRQAQASAELAQSSLYELSAQAEQRVSALVSENSLLAEGADRAQARIAELENEISALKFSAAGGANQSTGSWRNSADDQTWDEVRTLQAVLTEVRQEARNKEEASKAEKVKLEALNRELSQQLSLERDASARLRMELADRPSRDELNNVRRQLNVLQRVAFNVQDMEEDCEGMSGDPERVTSSGAGSDMTPLESVLTHRLKVVEAELAHARRAAESAKTQEVSTKPSVNNSESSLRFSVHESLPGSEQGHHCFPRGVPTILCDPHRSPRS